MCLSQEESYSSFRTKQKKELKTHEEVSDYSLPGILIASSHHSTYSMITCFFFRRKASILS